MLLYNYFVVDVIMYFKSIYLLQSCGYWQNRYQQINVVICAIDDLNYNIQRIIDYRSKYFHLLYVHNGRYQLIMQVNI